MSGIDLESSTVSTKRPQVRPAPLSPEKRMVQAIGQICPADNFAEIVHPGWKSVISTESADVGHDSSVPEERVRNRVTRKIRPAGDLTTVVGALPESERTSE